MPDEEDARARVFGGDEARAAHAARLLAFELDVAEGYRRSRHAVSVAGLTPERRRG